MAIRTEDVWETFNSRLRLFIRRRVPDEQSADDILQDIFLKIHTHIDTLKNEQKMQSWVYQIARNVIADHYRAQTVQIDPSDLPAAEIELPGEDVVAGLLPSLRLMVDALPPHYRAALILTEYEGLTQKELADALGISLSGAKSRVQRAREKLKQMLLNCCHFEFDRRGRVIDYQPHCGCCSDHRQGDSASSCC